MRWTEVAGRPFIQRCCSPALSLCAVFGSDLAPSVNYLEIQHIESNNRGARGRSQEANVQRCEVSPHILAQPEAPEEMRKQVLPGHQAFHDLGDDCQ